MPANRLPSGTGRKRKSANLVPRVLSEPSVTMGEKNRRGKLSNYDVTSSEFDRSNYLIDTYRHTCYRMIASGRMGGIRKIKKSTGSPAAPDESLFAS